MEIKQFFTRLTKQKELGISLGIYRISFGLLMCFSLLRFIYKGWVDSCYLQPSFHFSYQYFGFIKPIYEPAWFMYALVSLAAIFALLIALGIWYRLSVICFFLLFTYLELIEKSWYLNHYYFVSVIAFLLIWIPADHRFSVKRILKKDAPIHISSIYTNVLKLQISLVYFFAGLAKINSDWLLKAQPLKIWLKAKIDLPIIGDWLAYDWTAYLFSYSGMFYDLLIPFFLWNKRTRPYAFIAVIVFHSMTAILFQIGMFPWIMIVGSLIFLSDQEWLKIFSFFSIKLKNITRINYKNAVVLPIRKIILLIFTLHFILQIALPSRRFFYLENQYWTERHYRFGWNVMLIEKGGSATFRIKELQTNKTWTEYPSTHLTSIQEKQMSFQADMIWAYAQYLKDLYFQKGVKDIAIYVDCYVSFNGRPSQLLLPTTLDLLSVSEDEIYDHILDCH